MVQKESEIKSLVLTIGLWILISLVMVAVSTFSLFKTYDPLFYGSVIFGLGGALLLINSSTILVCNYLSGEFKPLTIEISSSFMIGIAMSIISTILYIIAMSQIFGTLWWIVMIPVYFWMTISYLLN